jgi:hypothetical protein
MEQLKYSSKVLPLRGYDHPKFKWVNSSQTDVRRTWRKARLLMLLVKGNPYESRT